MSLLKDAETVFNKLWKNQSVCMYDALRILESAKYRMLEATSLTRSLPTISEQQRRNALRDYRIITRNITQALKSQDAFDTMRALWYYLELWKGQMAYAKGSAAYQAFNKKWNAPKYNVFKKN